MPTVLRVSSLRFVIYANDHRPAHVHVIGTEAEAVFFLNCPGGPPILRENHRFKRSELARFEKELTEALEIFCSQWSAIHGDH